MTTPRITAEVSLGHLIQVATLVILAAVAWGVHTSTVQNMQKQMSDDRLVLGRHDGEIRAIDKTTSVVSSKLEDIRIVLQEVKAEVKRQ